MAEHLYLRPAATADGLHIPVRQLPGQHYPFHAQPRCQPRPGQGVQAHLCAGVEGLIRGHQPCQLPQAPILHQHRVHAPGGCLSQDLRRLGQLPVGEQGVQGEIDLHSALVTVVHGPGEVLVRKISGAAAGVKAAQAHVYSVGPVLHGGQQGLIGPGGGE